MPIILKPDHMKLFADRDGLTITTLADSALIGEPAMIARRWSLAPNKSTPQSTHGEQEQLLYVISGSGFAYVNGETLLLDSEMMLWLEAGDIYHLIAGKDGLELLQGYAPGD